MKAVINILPPKDDITVSSRNCLRNWTSGESSEPKAAVAMKQRTDGSVHPATRVVEVLTVWVVRCVVDSVVAWNEVELASEVLAEVEETVCEVLIVSVDSVELEVTVDLLVAVTV